MTDYNEARAASGKITAKFTCRASLETLAGKPGSLERKDRCSAISFDSSRPPAYSVQATAGNVSSGSTLQNCGYEGCVLNP